MQMKHFALCVNLCESTEEKRYKQIQTIMNTNNKNNTWGGQTYETPTVKELDIQSEGVLCGSYKWTEGGGGSYEDGDINDNGEY